MSDAPKLPELVIVMPAGTERREAIASEITLGRDPGNAVPIDDGYLSRRHCKVMRRADRVSVMDMRSYNGTFVNGTRIHEECFLMPGDVVRIGRTTLYVDWGQVADQSEGLPQVHAPNQEPKDGVEPVVRQRPPSVAPIYAPAVPPIPPQPIGARVAAGSSPSTRPDDERTLSLNRPRSDLRDKKTPVPPPAIEDSAVARAPSKPSSSAARDREGLKIIAQLARVLPSVEDENEFCEYALGKLLEVVPAERGVLMRLDPSRRGLYQACVRNALPGRDDQAARRLGVSHTIAKKVVRERVSVLVDDAKIDPRFKDASSIQDLEVRSILCAPLWLGETVSGLIYLDHLMHAYMFTESDRELVVAVANLIALGITNKGKKPAQS